MADKHEKPELEREYIIPLSRQVMKVPIYRRAKKAVKTIKEFLAKHMKTENRDITKVKLNKYLNQEVWFRGIKHPPRKIRVKVKKINGIVFAELADIPDKVKWQIEREKKQKEKTEKKEEKGQVAEEKKEEKTEEEKKEEKEKIQAVREAGLSSQKQEAKKEKHTSKQKDTQIHRQVMQR
jgi:large subunit ribosomal protein L31e